MLDVSLRKKIGNEEIRRQINNNEQNMIDGWGNYCTGNLVKTKETYEDLQKERPTSSSRPKTTE